jgi:hypothetical protein
VEEAKSPLSFDGQLRTMRIIHGALCAGVVVLAGVLIFVRMQQPRESPGVPALIPVGVALTAATLGMAVFLPATMTAAARRQIRDGVVPPSLPPALASDLEARLRLQYQTALILRCAPLEGAAFFWLIVYFLESQPAFLGAAGGLWVLLLLQFPTRGRVNAFVEKQRELIEQEKQGQAGGGL